MPHTIWVANGKGGVGKSVLMMVLAWVYDESGRPLRLVDADDKAKLAEYMGPERVLSLRLGASADQLRNNPSLAYSYWDQLANEIVERDTGVDLGANMDKHVLAWAEKSELASLFEECEVSMDCYVPVTADPLAVQGGIEVLQAVERLFPAARRVLVLNRVAGPFDAYAGTPEFADIARMRDAGLTIVEMDACHSEAWTDFERLKLPPTQVINMDAKAVSGRTGLGILAARRAIGDYATWLKRLHGTLAPLVKVDEQPAVGEPAEQPVTPQSPETP